MNTSDASFEGLTRLTRLAQLRGDGVVWLEILLARGRLEALAGPAIDVALESGDPIGKSLARAIAARATPALAARLMERFEDENVDQAAPLKEVALEVTRILLEHCRHRPEALGDGGRESQETLSKLWNRFAKRLYENGRPLDGLKAIEEACKIDRALAQAEPDVYEEGLAKSLANKSSILSQLGCAEEALEVIEEVVRIDRRCHRDRPDDESVEAHLALALHNLGDVLADLGHFREALLASHESMRRYRSLAGHEPRRYRLRLAETLRNHGAICAELNRDREAVEATREALLLLDHMGSQRPRSFEAEFAHLRLNLGVFLAQMGEAEEAIRALEEAEVCYRRLVVERPEIFEPDLALCLLDLGEGLSSALRFEEALVPAREALGLCRRLAATNPELFEAELAFALHNAGMISSECQRSTEAIAQLEEAVKRLRDLAAARPKAHLEDLAASLSTLGAVLGESGRGTEACTAVREAEIIYRRLARDDPERFMEQLISSQINLAGVLIDHEDFDEAVTVARDVIGLESGATPGSVTDDDLGIAWNLLSIALSGRGDLEGALQAASTSVAIRRGLHEMTAEQHRLGLASSLANLAVVQLDLHATAGAHAAAEESLRLLMGAPGSNVLRESVSITALRVYRRSGELCELPLDHELVASIEGIGSAEFEASVPGDTLERPFREMSRELP